MEFVAPVKRTRVCILESLPITEMQRTGYELHARLRPTADADPGALDVRHCDAPDVPTFESALRELVTWAHGNEVDPLLQIEAHGEESGLRLADGARLPWPRLGELLRPINEGTRNQLFVVLAACRTVPVVQLFAPANRVPFRRMIVSHRIVLPSELLAGFTAFYEKINETGDARVALAAMNDVTDAFGYLDSAMIMRITFDEWLKNSRDPAFRRQLALSAVMTRRLSGTIERADVTPLVEFLDRGYQQNPVPLFRKFAERYFWLDKFPEGREEFERDFAAITVNATAG